LYRSTQFAVFEAFYTKLSNNNFLCTEIPYTFGLQPRILVCSLFSATARSLIESPIEYFKVNAQTEKIGFSRQIYRGFGIQWVRTTGVMTTYFILIDYIRRNHPLVFSNPLGQFLASSMSATLGFWLVWPLEVLKNQVKYLC
jgi:solute carrier family 25 (mitochondrial carnitine/acylcarnitine transporter), member 20/29